MTQDELKGLTREQLLEIARDKEMWTGKEVRIFLSNMKFSRENDNPYKAIKIGDIHNIGAFNHPMLVIAVKGNNIYSTIVTSEPSTHSIIATISSRMEKWDGLFITSTISITERE